MLQDCKEHEAFLQQFWFSKDISETRLVATATIVCLPVVPLCIVTVGPIVPQLVPWSNTHAQADAPQLLPGLLFLRTFDVTRSPVRCAAFGITCGISHHCFEDPPFSSAFRMMGFSTSEFRWSFGLNSIYDLGVGPDWAHSSGEPTYIYIYISKVERLLDDGNFSVSPNKILDQDGSGMRVSGYRVQCMFSTCILILRLARKSPRKALERSAALWPPRHWPLGGEAP